SAPAARCPPPVPSRSPTQCHPKEEWWRRTQWALDRVPSEDRLVRDLGLDVLFLQAKSGLADKEDHLVIDTAAERLLGPVDRDTRADFAAVEYDEDTAGSGGQAR